jgi:hypothetical protein
MGWKSHFFIKIIYTQIIVKKYYTQTNYFLIIRLSEYKNFRFRFEIYTQIELDMTFVMS